MIYGEGMHEVLEKRDLICPVCEQSLDNLEDCVILDSGITHVSCWQNSLEELEEREV